MWNLCHNHYCHQVYLPRFCYPLINEIFSGKDSVLQGTETKDSDKITAESLETMDQKNQTIEHANVEKEAEFGQASVELKPTTQVCLVLCYFIINIHH